MHRTVFALTLAAATTLLHATDASSVQAMAPKELPQVPARRPMGTTHNHSPNFLLDEGPLTVGMESMLQASLDYFNGPTA